MSGSLPKLGASGAKKASKSKDFIASTPSFEDKQRGNGSIKKIKFTKKDDKATVADPPTNINGIN